MSTQAKPTYHIMTRRACMPGNCYQGQGYVRIGVVEIAPDWDLEEQGEPKMLSSRARGVARVVETWERLWSGKTERCAASRAMAEARDLVAELSAQ